MMNDASANVLRWKAQLDEDLQQTIGAAVELLRDMDIAKEILDKLEEGDYTGASEIVDAAFSIQGHPLINNFKVDELSGEYHVGMPRYMCVEQWHGSQFLLPDGYIRTVGLYPRYSRTGKPVTLAKVRGEYLVVPDRSDDTWRHGVYYNPDKKGWWDCDHEGRLEESTWRSRRRRSHPNRSSYPVSPVFFTAHRGKIVVVKDIDGPVDANVKKLRKDAMFVSRKLTRARDKAPTWSYIMDAIRSSWNNYQAMLGEDFGGLLPEDRAIKTRVKQVRVKLEG
jgi:hypothetical protein